MKVLLVVVDDDLLILEVWQRVIQVAGFETYELHCFTGGASALPFVQVHGKHAPGERHLKQPASIAP